MRYTITTITRPYAFLLLLLLLAAGLAPALACGSTETVVQTVVVEKVVEKQLPGEKVVQTVVVEKQLPGEKVVQTVIVEKQLPGEKVVQTVIVEKVVVATAVPAPTPAPTQVGGPRGSFTLGVENVIPPLFVPALGGVGHEQDYASWGMVEFLIYADHSGQFGPKISIAEEWTLAPDKSKVTFKIRKGIQFHKGYGELTADDVVWSMNNAIREGSTFWGAGGLQTWMRRWEKVDNYTAELYFKDFNPTWTFTLSNLSTHQPWIYPRKAVDLLGEAKANVTPLGSGPFENVLYRTNDIVTVRAFNGGSHWRARPAVEFIHVIEIPEALARVASFRVGETDIIAVPNKDIAQLKKQVPGSYEQPARGTDWPHVVYYTGNYWADSTCGDDKPTSWKATAKFPRPGFKPDKDHPWIGDPKGVGNSMESAKKVRQAMSMAIDRKTLVDTVFGGLGLPTATYNGFLPSDPEWKDSWDEKYDPVRAKQLLAEAGYPNGFSFTFYVPPDHIVVNPEAGQAVGQMWREIGLNVSIDSSAYAAARPRHFNGVDDIIWYHHSGTGNLDQPKDASIGPLNTFHGAETPCGIQALYWANLTEPERATRIQNNIKSQDYLSAWRLNFPIANITDYFMVGPRIKAWTPHAIAGRYFTNPETVQVR